MTNQQLAVVSERPPRSVLVDMASRYGMEPAAFEVTLRATVCKGNVSREEFAAFLLVAKEYGLNPMTKELYAFPAKGGGIQPIVSIDGWSRIINDHPMFDGMEFEDVREGDDLIAITCRMHRKDRTHSIEATEYMAECRRATDVWKTWPRRMLRHKAMIQCARYAFGFSGIVDPDEFERMSSVRDVTPTGLRERLEARQEAPSEGFTASQAEDRSQALDEALDGDQIPAHDAETGEVIDAEVEEKPTEEPKPEPTGAPSLADRAAAYEARLKAAPNTTKLTAIRNAGEKLRADLDTSDPERLVELEEVFNTTFAALQDAERAEAGQ